MKKKEDIIKELRDKGIEWVSGDYQNLSSSLYLRCEHGHEFFDSLKRIRLKTWKCPQCESDSNEPTVKVPNKENLRVLALDNAMNRCGWAIIENNQPIAHGTHATSASNNIEKISEVKQWFLHLMKTYDVDVIGLENVFYQGNPQTLIVLSMLLGVLAVTSYEEKQVLYIFSAGEWRSITGIKPQKRARDNYKQMAQQKVRTDYGMQVSQDTAEAILIGIATEKKYKYDQATKSGFGG